MTKLVRLQITSPRYYHTMKQDSFNAMHIESGVLLSCAELQNIHLNLEVANTYISRFLAVFKPFVNLNRSDPRHLRIQLQRHIEFRKVFEAEFGIQIICQDEINNLPDIDIKLFELLRDYSEVMYNDHICTFVITFAIPIVSA